jgi:hypothetical protein
VFSPGRHFDWSHRLSESVRVVIPRRRPLPALCIWHQLLSDRLRDRFRGEEVLFRSESDSLVNTRSILTL